MALPGFPIATAAGLAALLLAGAATAAPGPRLALVIGNGDYAELPALPACTASAGKVAEALKALEFEVMDRRDVTSGAMGAALTAFGRRMDDAPGASAVVYVCGYAAGMGERPFLLPVSANIRRPTDIMTQGILAKAAVDLLVRGEPSRALLALDLVPMTGSGEPPMDSLAKTGVPDGLGLIAAVGQPPEQGPTSLGAALAAVLGEPGIETGSVVRDVRRRLESEQSTQVAAARVPRESLPVAIEEAPPRAEPQAAPVSPVEAPPQPRESPARPPVAAAPPPLPDGPDMNDGQRRLVQEALKRVGYYAGAVDGIFGPETRAGIRRFQYEIGAEMTGSITGEQAAKLVTMPSDGR